MAAEEEEVGDCAEVMASRVAEVECLKAKLDHHNKEISALQAHPTVCPLRSSAPATICSLQPSGLCNRDHCCRPRPPLPRHAEPTC